MVLTLVEHDDEGPTDESLETLTVARNLAGDLGEGLEAVVFGAGGEAVADDLAGYGVDVVHAVSHEDLDTYTPEAWATALGQIADETGPDAVLTPGTARGQEVLAHLAATRDLPMAANCLSISVDDGYEVARQRWGGTLTEHAVLDAETKLLSVAPNEVSATPSDDRAEATVDAFTPTLSEDDLRVTLDRVEESDEEGVPLQEARVVVSGGRGVGSAEDYDKLEELAELLGGTVGASRAAVNEGWRPHDDQIGQTGAKISPDIYIPCGISGAVQHIVGCKGSENILAINTDPEAAIMGKADYAVVGDLHEVVPAIVEAVREAQA